MAYQLVLQANIDGWRAFVARRQQQAFQKAAPKVWDRDNNQCQFCGYKSRRFQEIVNLDGNYQNNIGKNLVTACPLCAHCLFLGAQGLGHNIIMMPNMTQAQVSHITRVLFCAMESESQFSETAKALYRNLRKFTEPVEEIFGKNASNAEVFGQCLLDTYNIEADKYYAVMQKIRLLPNPKTLKKQIQYWSKTVMPQLISGEVNLSAGGA